MNIESLSLRVAAFAFAILIVSSGATAAQPELGFSGGSNFELRNRQGQLTVQCTSPGQRPKVVVHQCRRIYLYPNEVAKIVGVTPSSADHIKLSVESECKPPTCVPQIRSPFDRQNAESAFIGNLGESADAFNLWRNSKPLLRIGKNAVFWETSKAGLRVASGSFGAEVTEMRQVKCDFASLVSGHAEDCDLRSKDRLCEAYLKQYDWRCGH